MANDDRPPLNPRTMRLPREANRPRGSYGPPGTNRPRGMERPREEDQLSEEIGFEEDEGKIQSAVFTERLKSGYSTACKEALERWRSARKACGERWQPMGPDNVGGRVTCLINLDGSGNDLIAGAACGGLWRGSVDPKLQYNWTAMAGAP